MVFPKTGHAALTGRLCLLAALCLALAMNLAAATPAHAQGKCMNRVWFNEPLEGTLFELGGAETTDKDPKFAVALSKNYAIAAWRKEFGPATAYHFLVGQIVQGSDGRKTINWNTRDSGWFSTDGSTANRPALAINDAGHVVIALEEPAYNIGWFACKVVQSVPGRPKLDCGKIHRYAFQGTNPSLAMNLLPSGLEQVVLAYQGLLIYPMYYHFGYFLDPELEVRWDAANYYGLGISPSIALNNRWSDVLETHFDAAPFTFNLDINVGQLIGSGYIRWDYSGRYEYAAEPSQSVALSDRNAVEFHQGAEQQQVYYRYGLLDPTTKEVIWQGGPGARQIGSDNSKEPCVAANNQGDVLMAWKDTGKASTMTAVGGLGQIGYGWACPWPTVTTAPATQVTQTSAVTGGQVTIEGDYQVVARGVCWSTRPGPTIFTATYAYSGSRFGAFTNRITGLRPDTRYYVRAFAINHEDIGYGQEVTFHTGDSPPVVHTLAPHFITTDTAWAGGAVLEHGEGQVSDRGLCWSTSPNPTLNNPSVSSGSGLGAFYNEIMGLLPDTTYHVRAYATNRGGTSYGEDIGFTTQHPSLPTVYSDDPLDLTASSAMLGGEVTREGSGPVTERGVVWSTEPKPNLNNHRAAMGGGPGRFAQDVTGFAPETTYHVRAYAINSSGHALGNEKMFATTAGKLPKVTTTAPYGETATSALSGGYVTNSGQTPVTARGVCWSTGPGPDLGTAHSQDGAGTGQFHSVVSGLLPETGYYVRAYATNSAGTAYGEEFYFHSVHPGYPSVQTLAVSDLTTASVQVSGQVVTEGGAPVGTRGICWSASPHPKVTDNVAAAGSGAGGFKATIGGLQPETVYYARAFASNQYGTAYGHIVNFRTTFCTHPCR